MNWLSKVKLCTRVHHFFNNFNVFLGQETVNVLRLVVSGFYIGFLTITTFKIVELSPLSYHKFLVYCVIFFIFLLIFFVVNGNKMEIKNKNQVIKSGYSDPSKDKCWKLFWATLRGSAHSLFILRLSRCYTMEQPHSYWQNPDHCYWLQRISADIVIAFRYNFNDLFIEDLITLIVWNVVVLVF